MNVFIYKIVLAIALRVVLNIFSLAIHTSSNGKAIMLHLYFQLKLTHLIKYTPKLLHWDERELELFYYTYYQSIRIPSIYHIKPEI